MRLFIAIELEKFQDVFTDLQRKISGFGRMALPKSFHLTLKFLGDVPDRKVEDIKAKLMSIKSPDFDVKLSGHGVFPSKNMVRVIWAGVDGGSRLFEVQSMIEACLGSDFPKDKEFVPHVTLARAKLVKDRQGLIAMLDKLKLPEGSVRIKEFKLIKSELARDGPVYEDILCIKLGGVQ